MMLQILFKLALLLSLFKAAVAWLICAGTWGPLVELSAESPVYQIVGLVYFNGLFRQAFSLFRNRLALRDLVVVATRTYLLELGLFGQIARFLKNECHF